MPEAKETDLPQKEWETARAVITKYDDLLDGLRRYGFTFIAGLLTAQSLLASNLIIGTGGNTVTATVLPSVKLSVILATLILIVGLRLLDRNYQLFQKAAAVRAQILEASLNLELTETITEVYRYDRMWVYIDFIYGFFAFAAGVLGAFLLEGNDWATDYLRVATVLAITAIILIHYLTGLEDRLDYTFDKLRITEGKEETITLTATNLGAMKFIPQGGLKWILETQDGLRTVDGKKLPQGENPEETILDCYEPYYFTLETASLKQGFYNLRIDDHLVEDLMTYAHSLRATSQSKEAHEKGDSLEKLAGKKKIIGGIQRVFRIKFDGTQGDMRRKIHVLPPTARETTTSPTTPVAPKPAGASRGSGSTSSSTTAKHKAQPKHPKSRISSTTSRTAM